MSERIPCPACGSESGPEAASCDVCGYRLDVETRDSGKCARCGQTLGAGFEFCQICGLRVQSRRVRPVTQSLRVAQPKRGEHSAVTPIGVVMQSMTPPVEAVRDVAVPGSERADAAEATEELEPVTMVFSPAAAVPVFEPAPAAAAAPSEWSPPSPPRVSQPSNLGPAPAKRRDPGASHLRLVLVQRDGSEGEVVPMGDAPLTIGRSQGDLRFPGDEFLTAAHARVDPLATGVRITDLGSRNGIYVRISRPEPVVPGDLFLIGHHLLRLENIPAAGREQDAGPDGVRGYGTPLQAAWGRLVLLGPGTVEAETHYLRHPQVVFGRELGDIVFPADPFVSWQHAQLSVEVAGEAMTVTLTDLRSANGTYLRARGDVILDPGDMFRVGDQIFRVRMH